MKVFDFPARVFVRGRGDNRKRGFVPDGSRLSIGPEVIAALRAGATGVVNRGGLWTVTVGVVKFQKEELNCSKLLENFMENPKSIDFEFISETGEQRVCYFFQLNPEINPRLG